jgi:prolyl oligopeptidase
MRAFLVLLPLLVAPAVTAAQALSYPATPTVDHADDYHGTRVADPYRWLEQDTAKSVGEWVQAQNEVTFGYLESIPFRDALGARLRELYDYPKQGVPQVKGRYLLHRRNSGLQNQAVIYLQEGEKGTPRVLIDPNTLSADGTTRVGATVFSRDGRHVAYTLSRAGSDWQEIRVLRTATGRETGDAVRWVKVSSIAWWKDGFFYSRYPAPADTAVAYSSVNEDHKVYYHRLGTPQSADQLVFDDPAHPQRFHLATVTEDERWLVLSSSDRGTGKRGEEIRVRDLAKGERGFRTLVAGFEDEFNLVDNVGDRLLFTTNREAPNWKLVAIDPARPAASSWRTVLAEREHVLQGVSSVGGRLVAVWLEDVSHRPRVFELDGTPVRDVPLPALGTVGGFAGERGARHAYYTFSNFTTPPTIYRYDVTTGTSTVWSETRVPYDPAAFETKQVFYQSKDGTRVPMFIVARKGLPLDGGNPTLLYGYGGFNISLLPSLNPLLVAFLEQGGVYAQPNLRGGGEYGERWHEAGMKANKQNVFDDFIAAAEWLVANGYTRPERLAIQGGSNGGLLVGAAMTQRPELFRVALPAVGVMDMLRFHRFTIGWNWIADYGSSDDPEGFRYLSAYSPLHNLKDGVSYPATLVTTADHDDRVVPAHSFKFAARLQAAHRGPNPVLIRIETQSGHGASSTAKALETTRDVYAFAMQQLGMRPTYSVTP